MPPAEVGEPDVVLRVRDHVVDVVRLALGRALERLPSLDLSRGDIEPVHAGEAVVLRPHLAVHVRSLRAHHVDLRGVDVLLGRQLPGGEFRRLAVELEDRRLVHVAEPQVPRAISAQTEEPRRESRFVHVDGKFRDLARLRIEAAEVLLAEARIPGDALGIDDDVVRRDRLARQVVFGVDDARRAARGARKRLELVAPLLRGAAVDRGEILGGGAVHLDALIAALLHQPLGFAQLRMLRNALVHVALHARQDRFRKGVGVVRGARHALERVAADAIQEQAFLLVGAGHARHPFAVGELRGEVRSLPQLEVERGGLLRGDLRSGRSLEVVADRADANRVAAGVELRGGKAVAAFLVAHHRDRDRRARPLRADQHALHYAFFGGADFAGERGLRGGAGGIGGERGAQDRRRDERMCSEAHGRLPGKWF